MTPGLSFAFEARILVDTPLDVGSGPDGQYRIIPILGGAVEGPAFTGSILPGGADWQSIRSDGTLDIEARYAMRAEDGAVISIVNQGVRHAPLDVMKRLASGAPVEPTEYYFRTAPRFQAADGPYYWMTRATFVATGERRPDLVVLRVWSVL